MVCKNWFLRLDWYYIGTILVCTKSKMTNRFSAMSAEGPGAHFEPVIAAICPSLPNPRAPNVSPRPLSMFLLLRTSADSRTGA